MVNYFKALSLRHASLLLLGTFSVCYFAAMIIARKTLEPVDFYFWNALVTLVAMGFTFCFFGAEQLFLRFSNVANEHMSINRLTLWLMLGSLVLFVALLTTLSERYFFQLGTLAVYPLLGVAVGIFVFVYNFLRVLKAFNTSQLAANGWKFTILIAVILSPLGNAQWIILAGLIAACGLPLWLFVQNRHRLVVTNNPMPDNWKSLFLGFLLSLFVLMLLNNADRLIMTRYSSESLFSEYVYLVTLVLMPFSLLSNYFGFKEMAYLKQSYSRALFVKKMRNIAMLAAGLFVPWFLFIYGLRDMLELEVRFEYILPCMVIITCRCSYALLSTLFGLKGKPVHIHVANLLTLVAIVLAVAVLLMIGVDVANMLSLIAVFWCIRLAIYSYFTTSISEYEANYAI